MAVLVGNDQLRRPYLVSRIAGLRLSGDRLRQRARQLGRCLSVARYSSYAALQKQIMRDLSLRSPKARRGKLVAHMSAGLSLASKPQKSVSLITWWDATSLFAQALGLLQEMLIKRNWLFGTTSFHGAAPFRERKAGAQSGVLITDKSQVPGGDGPSWQRPGQCVGQY